MFLFYTLEQVDQHVKLSGDEHQHCSKVLRKQQGDQIFVTDGKGHIFTCNILSITKTETICKIVFTEKKTEPSSQLSIAISPTKTAARIEWFVEKVVEIGISSIIIFQGQRTEKKSWNKTRLEKIMVSAMKQSMNVYLPELQFCSSLADVIKTSDHIHQKFIAHCDGPTTILKDIMAVGKSAIVLIGPEGDFTESEISLAHDHKYIKIYPAK
ncbi:MAG: 16S rRNA (uracil(1498)-N(3))-methyltransferase [Saprospiraceae bacterium]|nr:16S rRNA (uracil(1498)-N(3))-methyltransferase [Saprospiraceae bacterium]